MPSTAPAYTIGGITRPELNLDDTGHIILTAVVTQFIATYGLRMLFIGLPANTPLDLVNPTLSVPVDANAGANNVAEGAPAGTSVGLTVSATNNAGPAPTYSLTADSSGGGFQINALTGVVTVANGALLDFESHTSFTVTAQATSLGLVTSQTFTITLGDVNDNAPVFTSGTTATTPENIAPSTVVYTAHANDADGTAANNTVHYSLAAGGDNDLFHIDPNTGAVTFITSPDADHPQDVGLNNVYDITVTASDGLPAHNVTRNVAITVTDVNEAPVITSNGGGDTATVNLNEGTAAVTTVTATDPDVPVQGLSFSVLTGAGSPDGTSFTIDGLGHLSFISAPDFENPGPHGNSYTVQVRVTDNGAPNLVDTQTITVNVADLNDNAPVFTSPTTAITPENVATTTAVYTALAPDADGTAVNNTVHYSLAGGVGDNDLFSIDADTGAVTFIASPDFETPQDLGANNVYDIVVTASDGLPAHDTTRSVAITVTDVNDNAPVITSGTGFAVDENSAGGTPVATIIATDADASSPNNTLTYTATGGTGFGLFDVNLNTGAVTVHNSVVLDREAAALYTLDIVVADGGTPGLIDTQTIAINLNDLNDNAPQFASPTGSAGVNEAISTATVVFDANATDADIAPANHTITYSLGGSDAGDFAINASTGEVTFAVVPNFESPADTGGDNVYDFTVIAHDGVPAHDTAQAVTITVGDLPPEFATPSDSNAAANQTFDGAPVGSSTGIDAAADDPAGGTVTYSLFNDAGGRFAINPTTGVVTVAGPIVFTGTPADTVMITVRASDPAGAHNDLDYFITILQEQPPEVTPFNTLANYTENQGPAVIDAALTATDPNNTTLVSATVQITGNYVAGEDVLAFANTATITATFNPGNGTLTLTGTDTVANYQAALRTVTYVNTSDNPSPLPRTVEFKANDGTVNSAPVTDTFTVTPVNDAPVIGASHILPYTENQTPTAIDPLLTLTDVDSANLNFATVQITGNYVDGEDILAFAPIGNITGLFDTGTGTMTLSGIDTVANYQLALRAVTYFNTSDNPSTLARTVTFIANDGAAGSTPVTDSITVAPVDDAPEVDTAAIVLTYTEGGPAVSNGAVLVSDDDSASLTFATVQIAGNYVEGQDLLSFTTQNGITGSFNATTGTMTLSGLDSVANYQTALRSVAYSNTSSHPLPLDRTLTYIASDGSASSTPDTTIVHITPVNSPPDLTPNSPPAASYTENAAASALLATGAIVDPDSPAVFTGGSFTAVITANAATGDQLVLLASPPFAVDGSSLLYAGNLLGTIAGLGTTSVSVTGLTAEATPTVVNLLARAFGFQNSSDDPATAARGVTFTFHDGGNTGGGDLTDTVTQTVNVTALNDAPVNTVPSTLQVTDTATNIAISGLSVSDVDSEGASETTTLHVANGTLVVATIAGGAVVSGSTTSTVTLTGTIAEINITLAAAGNIVYHPVTAGSDTLTVTTNDNGHSPSGALLDTDTVPILVTAAPAANAPALDLDGPGGDTGFTASFTEGLAAVPIADSDATIIDADSPMMASATITLTNHQAGDLLSVNGTLPVGISVGGTGYDPLTGILTLTGAASPGDYAAALHQIEFSNGTDNPSTVDRSIAVVVNDDGAHASNTAIATIHVAGTNDAPVVDLDASTPVPDINYTASYTATGPFVAIAASNDSVTDADNATLVSATVTLTDAKPNDLLAISGLLPAGITAAIDTSVANQITVTLSGIASPASYQAALHQVVFANSDGNPDLSQRHINVTVSDGLASSLTATTTINVALNQAPVANDDAVSATEAGGVNNAIAGINPSGNLITGTGAAGAVADSDVEDPVAVLTVVAVHKGAAGDGGDAGLVGTGLQGLYGTLTLNVDGSYSYAVNNSNATVQGLTSASLPIHDFFNYTIQDSGGQQDTATLDVSISGANDLPLASADTGTLTEDAAPTTFSVLGNDALDPDTGALNTIATGSISATGPVGTNIDPTDVSVAVIGGTQVQITLGADFQKLTGSESATVTVPYTLTGNTGETTTANLVVTVNGVNDLPVAVNDLTGNTMTEDTAATTFSVLGNDTLDVDHGAANTITTGTVTASGPAGANIDASDVTVSLAGGGTQIQVTLGADFQHLQEGQTATIDVPYTLHGNGADASSATLEVSVTGLNDAPVVIAGAGSTFTENGPAVSVAGSLTLSDVDNTTMSGATVSLTNAQANDILSVQGQGASGDLASGVHFVVDNTAHTVTFSAVDSVADYQAALRLVQFSNSSENPTANTRAFTITADDGQTLNHVGSASATLTVVAVDDAPVNTIPADAAVPTAFSNTDTAISGISVTDVDSGTGTITTQLSVTNGIVSVTLAGGALIVAGASGTNTLTLSGSAAAINATLANNVTFHSTDGFTGQANLTVVTNDQGNTGTGGPLSDTDVVHIGVVPQVWFIDNTNAGPGNGAGTTADPFHSIAAFNASAGPGQNDYIVIRTGTGTYTGDGLNLQDGQQVYGTGETLSFTNPVNSNVVTILNGTGTRPTINVTTASDQGIDLAANNTIHGVNITTAAGTSGLDDGNNAVGTLTVDHMTISGAGRAVDIDQGGALSVALESVSSTGGAQGIQLAGTASSGAGLLSGSFSATGGAISGSTTAGFLVGDGAGGANTGGTATISYAGTISAANGVNTVNIQDHSTGLVTFSGALTHTVPSSGGSAIVLDDNSSSFTFSGANSNLNSGASTAINITDQTGGTVLFSGANLNIDTTSATGVNLGGTSTGTFNFTGGNLTIDTTGGNGFVANSSTSSTVNVTGSGNHINSSTGTALSITSTTIGASNVTFQDISTTNAANAIVIDTVSGGDINVNGGTIAGASNRGVDINAAQSNITIASSITSTAAGRSVEVTNSGKVGGNTISFSGAITDPGLGINLDNNDQGGVGGIATINFSGGLNIDSTVNTGFNATNGGTVNVTNGANNSIVTTSGTALNVVNTNIGASDITFQSISAGTGAGSAGNGIVLDTTGSAGGLHVTGTGTAGSGGTIQHKTGADGSTTQGIGIYLNATSEAEFAWMQLNDLQNFGIRGNNVTGFKFDNSVINGTNGTAAGVFDEAAISFNNLLGSASISNSNIANGFEYILKVLNDSGTLNRLIIDNTDFGTNNTALGGDAVQIVASNTATANVTVINSGFINAREDLFNAVATQSANMDVVFRSNTLSNNHTNKVSAASNILVFSTSTGSVTYDISHNTLTTGATGSAIAAAKGVPDAGSGGTMTGTINANTIGVAGVVGSGSEFTGIFASALGSGTHTTAITNNVIRHYNEEGIFLKANDNLTGGNSVLNATVTGNITTEPDSLAFAGLWVVAGSGSGTENNVVNLVVGNSSTAAVAASPTGSLQNDFTNGDPANSTDVFLQESGSNSVINLSRAGSAAGTAAGVIQDDNVGTPAVVSSGTVNLVNTLPPTPPPVAPLVAAMGGVQASSPTPGETHLSQAQLDSVVAAAIAQWAHAGASAAQLAALSAITFTVTDLTGNTIGDHNSGYIFIDTDAAGHGWFVDPTPSDNFEFSHAANAAGTDLLTDPTNAAAGHLDLLTAVAHEMGHELGLPDLTAAADAHDLMHIDLVDGERRLPDAGDVPHTNAAPPQAGNVQASTAGAPAVAFTTLLPLVMGTPGNDIVHAGQGGNILVGMAGADQFVFTSPPAASAPLTHVADYSFAQGDTFDFSALTSAFHAWGISDASVVRAVEDPSGWFATLQVNASSGPNAANWVDVARLDGAQAGDDISVLIDSHAAVHAAHLHVGLLV